MKRFEVLLAAVIINITTAFGCWYKTYDYEDYIYAVNNREVHTEIVAVTNVLLDTSTNITSESYTPHMATVASYRVKNNMVVDFPISVSVKLVSNAAVILDGIDSGVTKREIMSCALQYRVLPNGNWVTVQKYETQTGTIPSSYPPTFYFGRNNISPKCKPGDVIMIRVYVTDNVWHSGDPASLCDEQLIPIQNPVTTEQCMSLQDSYTFNLRGVQKSVVDLGGQWTPNLVTTVIWSGQTRAAK